jgi:hypothetical protein
MNHNTSCHPTDHETSGISYLINRAITYPISEYNINRAITYPISEYNINKEKQTIDHLLKANGYHRLNASELIQHRKQHTRKENNQKPEKMDKFYVCRQRNKICNKTS